MKTKPKYTLISGDDWCGLYKNGKLVTEGHSIKLTDFAKIIGIDLEVKWINQDWLENRGCLPKELSEVKYE